MGRYSNLVLVQNGKIIDALKRVDFEDSDVRQLLPGLPYTAARPSLPGPTFWQVSAASIVAAACERDLPVARCPEQDGGRRRPGGLPGSRLARLRRGTPAGQRADRQKQKAELAAAIDELKEIHARRRLSAAVVTAPDGKAGGVHLLSAPAVRRHGYLIKEWPSFNAMLEGYYAEKDRAERLRTKSKELHKAVHNMYERAVRKQAARKEELSQSAKADTLRLYGELLQANLWAIHKGDRQVTVQNYYTGEDVTIRLDPGAARRFTG